MLPFDPYFFQKQLSNSTLTEGQKFLGNLAALGIVVTGTLGVIALVGCIWLVSQKLGSPAQKSFDDNNEEEKINEKEETDIELGNPYKRLN